MIKSIKITDEIITTLKKGPGRRGKYILKSFLAAVSKSSTPSVAENEMFS